MFDHILCFADFNPPFLGFLRIFSQQRAPFTFFFYPECFWG